LETTTTGVDKVNLGTWSDKRYNRVVEIVRANLEQEAQKLSPDERRTFKVCVTSNTPIPKAILVKAALSAEQIRLRLQNETKWKADVRPRQVYFVVKGMDDGLVIKSSFGIYYASSTLLTSREDDAPDDHKVE